MVWETDRAILTGAFAVKASGGDPSGLTSFAVQPGWYWLAEWSRTVAHGGGSSSDPEVAVVPSAGAAKAVST